MRFGGKRVVDRPTLEEGGRVGVTSGKWGVVSKCLSGASMSEDDSTSPCGVALVFALIVGAIVKLIQWCC